MNTGSDCCIGESRDANRSSRVVATFAIFAAAYVIGGGMCSTGVIPNGNDNDDLCPPGMADAGGTVSYQNDIRPLLESAGCLSASCHGGLFPPSNFSLATYESSFNPGDEARSFRICPIVPGDADASYLVEKIGPSPRTGARMPFLRPPLTDGQIELIRTWIDEGAREN